VRRLLRAALVLGATALCAVSSADTPSPGVGPNDFDRLLADMDAEHARVRKELDAIGPELDVVRLRTVARGRAYYRKVRAGLLPIGGGFDALVDHAARVERTRKALERDLALEASLGKRERELSARLSRLEAERAPLEVQREAMQRARAALVEADERRRAFERAFDSSSRPGDYLAVYGAEAGPTDVDARLGFAALKGRLPFPVAGRAEVRRVKRAASPALELGTGPSAAVRSVAAGRVVFADRYDEYGLTVILDHGDAYFSIYASLGATDAKVGDRVAAGARLGAAGDDGKGRGVVYFELRNGGSAVDPAPWLGL
jgi:septal ring factor EnvC (AmiA/AmiB activator)